MNRAVAALLVLLAAAAPARSRVAQAFFTADGIAPLADDARFQVRLFHTGLSGAGTVEFGGRDFLTLGASYDVLERRYFLPDWIGYRGANEPSDDYLNRNHLAVPLHATALSAAYAHSFGSRWALAASLGAGYAGDYHRYDLRDTQPLASLEAAVRLHPTFRLTFGLSYREAFRPWFATPTLGWEWRPTPWFHSEARLPRSVDFDFVFLDRIEAGVFGLAEGHDYRVRENRLGFDRLLYLDARAGVSMGFRVIGDLWLAIQGGYSPYRLLSGRGAGDKETWGGRMENVWFGGVTLDLRSLAGQPTPPAAGEIP